MTIGEGTQHANSPCQGMCVLGLSHFTSRGHAPEEALRTTQGISGRYAPKAIAWSAKMPPQWSGRTRTTCSFGQKTVLDGWLHRSIVSD